MSVASRWVRAVVLAAATTSVAMAGCLGGDDTSGGPFVPVTELVDAYRAAECQHLVACHEMPDPATCLATNLTTSFYVDPISIQLVLAGRLRYNGSQVATCFAKLAASSCDPGALENRRPVEQCLLGVFSGAQHAGEACDLGLECISGTCGTCSANDTCCGGTCVGDTAPPPVLPIALGEACPQGTGNFDACEVGLYCDAQTSTCQRVKPLGSSCLATRECGNGLQCDALDSGTCVSSPHLDEPCTRTGRCGDEGTYCGNDLVCHAVSLAGDVCGGGQACASYTYCDGTAQRCVPYPDVGEDCGTLGRCGPYGTHCDFSTETCMPDRANHEACTSAGDCASRYCDPVAMTCLDPPTCPA